MADAAMNAETLAEETRSACRILYPDGGPSWDCMSGWFGPISKLSYRLESLNMMFRRVFGVHAEADQIKEKFGGLRFYYTVYRDQPRPVGMLRKALKDCADAIWRAVDFKIKHEIVKPSMNVMECREVDPSDGRASPGDLVSESGMRCSVRTFKTLEMTRPVPGRMKPLWFLMKRCAALEAWMSTLYVGDVARQEVGQRALEALASEMVGEAARECFSTCEACGRGIGTPYSPRCETTGWISYLCEKCARERGVRYKKDGWIYGKDGVMIEKSRGGGEEAVL